MRPTAEKRHNDWTKAIRKRRIDRERFGVSSIENHDWYNNLHQYSKNKIFCSCPLCASKTNPSKYAGGGPAMNWSIRDRRRQDEMRAQEKEEVE